MFKLICYNKDGSEHHSSKHETMEILNAFNDSIEAKKRPWGMKPHRFVTSQNLGDEDITKAISSVSEENDFGDVIITYEFAAEYTIEIIDITAEHEDEMAILNRKREYPPIDEIVEALIEDNQAKILEIRAKREAVKLKYPKRVK